MVAGAGRRSAAAAVLAVLAVGVLVLLAAAVRPGWQIDPDSPFVVPTPGLRTAAPPPPLPTVQPEPVQPPVEGSGSVVPWSAVLVGGLAVGVAVAAMRWWRTRRPRQVPELAPAETPVGPTDLRPGLPALLQGATSAEAQLLGDGKPGDAIVAAWLALEQAAAGSGVTRPAAATATEFTADVLALTGAPEQPVRELLALYLRVRFGTRPADEDDRRTARRWVRELADHWEAYARPAPQRAAGAGSMSTPTPTTGRGT